MDHQPVFYGNETASRFLTLAGEGKITGHAYLIYGEDGLGKKTFAEYFAKALLCKGFPKPCFCCSSCHKIAERIHPDVTWYLGGEGKNTFHIDRIRELRRDCAIKPNESERKIYILTNVQNMSLGAYNAFLKTLEEPPSHAMFLLTAPNLDALPDTIVSRVIPIQLFPLSDSLLKETLYKTFPEKEKAFLDSVAVMARGNLGLAKQLAEAEEQFAYREAEDFCRVLASGKEYELLKFLAAYEKDKEKLIAVLSCFEQVLRSMLFYKFGIISAGISAPAEMLAKRMTRKQVQDMTVFTGEVMQKLKTNANGSLLTAYLCVGMMEIIH